MSDEFEGAVDSGASLTVPSQASAIRKGGHLLMKGRPCKVVDTSTCKTGKHGSAKCHLVGIDIFTGKKYEEISPSTHNMQVPIVNRKDYQFIDVSEDGYVSLMNDDGNMKEDLKLPEEEDLRSKLQAGGELIVSVLSAMNEEKIVAVKESS